MFRRKGGTKKKKKEAAKTRRQRPRRPSPPLVPRHPQDPSGTVRQPPSRWRSVLELECRQVDRERKLEIRGKTPSQVPSTLPSALLCDSLRIIRTFLVRKDSQTTGEQEWKKRCLYNHCICYPNAGNFGNSPSITTRSGAR